MIAKRVVVAVSLSLAFACPMRAQAGIYGDDFGKCLVKKSTDKDKETLAIWIFSAISLKSTLSPYVDLPAEKREEIDKDMAALFEKLVGETCKEEAANALKYEGASAFGVAFQLLGQVAGQQIFATPEVNKGSENFMKYLDTDGLQKKLGVAVGK